MVLGAIVIVIVGILVVNYFKGGKSQTLSDALSTQNETAKPQFHTVTQGESLWSIAEDTYGSGYNWTDISKVNGLKSENIEVGQKLSLPTVPAKKPTIAKQVLVAQKPDSSIAASTYKVVRGDSLWKISVRAYGDGYQWVKIARENKLVNPNLIHPGNILTLPR